MSVIDYASDKKVVIEKGSNDRVERTVRVRRVAVTAPAGATVGNTSHGIENVASKTIISLTGYLEVAGPIFYYLPHRAIGLSMSPTVVTLDVSAVGAWSGQSGYIFIEYVDGV